MHVHPDRQPQAEHRAGRHHPGLPDGDFRSRDSRRPAGEGGRSRIRISRDHDPRRQQPCLTPPRPLRLYGGASADRRGFATGRRPLDSRRPDRSAEKDHLRHDGRGGSAPARRGRGVFPDQRQNPGRAGRRKRAKQGQVGSETQIAKKLDDTLGAYNATESQLKYSGEARPGQACMSPPWCRRCRSWPSLTAAP